MVDSSLDKNGKYAGLSRREFEMRRKMAAKFGRQVSHLEPTEPDLKIDLDQLYKKLTIATPSKPFKEK